jgi:general secretion pathway protein D
MRGIGLSIGTLGVLFVSVGAHAQASRAATRPAVDVASAAGGAQANPTIVPLGQPGASNAAGSTGGQGAAAGAATGATGGATGAATGPGGGAKRPGDTSTLPAWEKGVEFSPLNPNQLVDFSMEDADLTELVRVIANITGRRFIFGGKVRNIKASVYSPQKVTAAEAYQAFLSILETNGLTVVPHGRFLKIIETTGIASQETPLYNAGQGTPTEDRFITRVHRLAHAQADEVANVLGHFKSKDGDITIHPGGNLLIMTDTGSNIRRMMQIVDEIDVGGSSDQVWIEPIHYASASDIAARINDLFDLKAAAGPGGGKTTGAGAAPAAQGSLHVTKVVADDRSNSVIIVATEPAYLRILEFIKRLDLPQSAGADGGEIHVLPLQHADAVELTKTLNDIISGATQGAAAGPSGAPGGARPAAPGNEIFEGRIKVSADKATNSIVVTSSMRDYAALRFVVDRLDVPRRQVFIEAVIMDLSINRSDTMGVSFHGGGVLPTQLDNTGNTSIVYGGLNPLNTVLPPGTSDPSLLQGLALGIRGPDVNGTNNLFGGQTGLSLPAFGVIINAIATAGDADVLSTPHVLATDNEKAVINIGENVPLQTNIGGIPSLGGAAGAGAGTAAIPSFGFGFGVSPQRTDVGTKIEITPHLNESDEVRLDITEEISEAREPQGQLGVVPITKRNAQTKLVVKDQQTVVIGGLMRNRVTHTREKIPVLGDIPVLGVLFRKSVNSMQKSNLVLVLTPYIIREQADLRKVFERKMQERQEFLDRYFVFSENSDYQPPRDYSRTNGLLEEIRQSYISIDERRKLEDLLRPKDLKTHSPGQPLEIPSTSRGGSSAAPATQTTAPATGATPPPNVNVAPAIRSLDRTEH